MATDLLHNNTAAAPSVTYDEFPAVVVPFFLSKAGLNLAKPSIVVYALIPLSFDTTISFKLPSLSFTYVWTGTISSS